jgi:hypothetical protein
MPTAANLLYLLAGLVIGAAGGIWIARKREISGSLGIGADLRSSSSSTRRTPNTTAQTSPTPSSQSAVATDDADIELSVSPREGVKLKTRKSALLLTVLVAVVLIAVLVGAKLLLQRPSEKTRSSSTITVIVEIYARLQRGVERAEYEIQPHPNHEVVAGLVGSYYVVDLKSATNRESLFFGPAEYVKNEVAVDFRSAVQAFRRDVLAQIGRAKVPYQIFVEGTADITGNDAPYLAALLQPGGKQISYLPRELGNPNLFSQQPVTETVPHNYANIHLPNLRAAFVQEKLAAFDLQSTVLEGEVTKVADPRDRHAVMLLYVNWPTSVTQPHS